MPCEQFTLTATDGSTSTGIICWSQWYRFEYEGKAYHWEWHSYFGALPISKRSGDPLVRVPGGFYEAVQAWKALPEDDREACAWSPWETDQGPGGHD